MKPAICFEFSDDYTLHRSHAFGRIVGGAVHQRRDRNHAHVRGWVGLEQRGRPFCRQFARRKPLGVGFGQKDDGHPVVRFFHQRIGACGDDGARVDGPLVG